MMIFHVVEENIHDSGSDDEDEDDNDDDDNNDNADDTFSAAPQSLDSEVPGPSNVASTSSDSLASKLQPTVQNKEQIHSNKTKRRGKGKGKGKSRKKNIPISYESDEKCTVCNKPDIGDEDWICCDACYLWYHRDCANLQDDETWASLSDEGAVFTCPLCQ
ncbi:unnamed protein product [Mytilus coruscus]|uniref:PHD-type domain-containing protein n=1 Tax=Mytilus coruscus TaxID=42192 RepID=A0A6J8EAP4_MYTCO|nr:unnamed protein product [Mytilus coruscus]